MLLRLLGPGALTLLSSNTLANWFHRRLGMVEGIRHVGMATAMAVIPAVHLGLLESFGWRGADIVLGLLIWAVMLPLMLLAYRERPEDVGQRLDGDAPEPAGDQSAGTTPVDSAIPLLDLTFQQALRTPSFWIVACGTSTFGIVHTAIFFCIVPIFLDRGLTETHATAMLTVFAMSLAVMQFVGGLLADRVRPTLLMPFAMGGLTVSVLLLVRMSHPAMGLAAGIGLGVSQGLFFAASNPLWARYFGRLQLGRIRGTVSTMNIGSSSLGPLLCGVCRDLLGSYQPVLVLFALLPLPLIVMCCWASPPLSPDGNESPAS